MAVEIRIVRSKGGVTRNFIFESGETKEENIPQTSQSSSLSIPKDSPTDSAEDFTIDLGILKELNLTWKLYKQTTDRSEGTAPAVVKTYQEMLDYLEDVICFPGIGVVDYTITITDKFRTRTAIYTFDSFNIDTNQSLRPSGTMKFKWKKQVV
jgi:hypothetical protein